MSWEKEYLEYRKSVAKSLSEPKEIIDTSLWGSGEATRKKFFIQFSTKAIAELLYRSALDTLFEAIDKAISQALDPVRLTTVNYSYVPDECRYYLKVLFTDSSNTEKSVETFFSFGRGEEAPSHEEQAMVLSQRLASTIYLDHVRPELIRSLKEVLEQLSNDAREEDTERGD